MYQYTPRAPVRTYPENRTYPAFVIAKSELTTRPRMSDAYQAVRATGQQTAKFWDCNPTKGGNTAHTQGGFFSPVECAERLMPGMRGLQDGENRNKRVVPFRTITVPGKFAQM